MPKYDLEFRGLTALWLSSFMLRQYPLGQHLAGIKRAWVGARFASFKLYEAWPWYRNAP